MGSHIVLIATAIGFVFSLCFATRSMDNHWKDPATYRLVYMLLGLGVGTIGYLITVSCFRIAGQPAEGWLFFAGMIAVDALAAIVGKFGMCASDHLYERILGERTGI